MIRVLVADDEEKVAQLVCNLVDWRALDMEVVGVAHNGLEALEMIGEKAPDIVVTDIRMPGCDGLELIGKAKRMNPALEFIIISGYRHFDYAQSAIRHGVSDYLLKPVNKAELTATLAKMRRNHMQRSQLLSRQEQDHLRLQNDNQRLRSAVFSGLAAQDGAFSAGLSAVNREYGLGLAPGLFEVSFFKLDGSYDVVYTDGLAVLREKIAVAVEKELRPVCAELQLCFAGTTGQILMNYPAGGQEAARKALRDTFENMQVNNVFPEISFTLARGPAVGDVASLPASLAAARRLLASRLCGGAGRLLEGEAPAANPALRRELQTNAFRALEMALDVRSADALQKTLDALGKQVTGLPGEDLLELCDELCKAYLLLARSGGIPLADHEMVYDEFCARLDLCASAEGALDCLRQTVSITFAAAMKQQGEEDAKPIRLSKQYIQEHFTQPISLEEVAGRAGFNPSYFSTLFKKETGQTFSEYLTFLRMEKAKEQLRDTSLPIARVCQEVGYADLKHFTALFKKHAGIKPGEFRKLYS